MTDARTHRINAVADDLATRLREALERLLELADLDVPATDVMEMLAQRKPDLSDKDRDTLVTFGFALVGSQRPAPTKEEAMRAHIDGLFTSDGKKLRETDTPALESVVVWLNGVIQPIGGTLSKTPNGLLKLGSFGQSGQGGPAIMIEQVFAYEDVISIAISREAKMEPSSIFTSH